MPKAPRTVGSELLQAPVGFTEKKLPPVLIGICCDKSGARILTGFLNNLSKLSTKTAILLSGLQDHLLDINSRYWHLQEAFDDETISAGIVYHAPDHQLLSVSGGNIRLLNQKPGNGLDEPADQLFQAMAGEKNPDRIGVILSANCFDGLVGMTSLHESGGITMVYNRMGDAFFPEKFHRHTDLFGTPEGMSDYLNRLFGSNHLNGNSRSGAGQPWSQLFSTTIARSIDAVMICSGGNNEVILYVNDAFTRLTGYQSTEILGKKPSRVLFHETIAFNGFSGKNQEDGESSEQRTLITKNNKEITVSEQRILFHNGPGESTHVIYSFRELSDMQAKDKALAMAVFAAREKERQDLSGELHDNVNQILVTAQVTLGMAKNAVPDEAREWIQKSNEYIGMAVEEIRRLSYRLAAPEFHIDTFCDAIRDLAEGINANGRYQLRFSFDPQLKTLSPGSELMLNLYRIVQEQLKNIVSYAEASRIYISLRLTQNDHIRLRVADNGVGFDCKHIRRGMGITNMRRRAEFFHGSFDIVSAPGKGCVMIAEVPVS